jgi:serine O-acetyltransferase
LIDNFKYDMRRYNILNKSEFVDYFSILNKMLFTYGLHAIAVYRFGRWADTRINGLALAPIKGGMLLVYCLLAWVVRKAYGIDLSNKADIGPGLYIGHFGGIEVKHCTIGSNCSIHQHTKILPGKGTGRPPHVGSKVWIGAHAIIEGCTIGDNVTIAAGARVRKDVEKGNLVVGNPARVVAINYENQKMLGTIT